MAVDRQQNLGKGTPWTPDSLPMGTDFMESGQTVARHLLSITPYKEGLPDRARINEVIRIAGYQNPKVIDVIGGLLESIHRAPTSESPNVRRYLPVGTDTNMAVHLYGGPAVILTTTPHRRTGWEMHTERGYDQDALTEYNGLYGREKPPYRFKMVIYDPGPKGPEGPEGEESTYNLDVLAKASQLDRKLPPFGLHSQDWRWKGVAARWAIMFHTESDSW